MKRRRSMPLGVDVGTSRTRVALTELDGSGAPSLVAVAVRATAGDPARAIAEARTELATGERRCVLSIAPPDSVLQTARFPDMRATERTRAARYEASRFVTFPLEEATVRVSTQRDATSIVAIAHRPAADRRIAAARRAGLQPIAVDDAVLALLRALPHADAIVDVGESGTLVVIRDAPVPFVRRIALGGGTMTAAIVASLGIDEAAAERRKCTVGLAGAAEHARDALVDQIASAVIEHRANARSDIRAIALTGNGARLGGLPAAIERAAAIPVSAGVLSGGAAHALPPDVIRAASPDWALAFGLALWETAA